MTLEQGAYLAEILGVIFVVVTLIYLSVQIRQGTELLRSESRQALVTNDITSLAAEDELSAEDQLRLSFIFALDLRNREFEYFQYTNGLLDEQTWLAYRHVILINHSTSLGRAWWDDIGRDIVDPAFAKLVDELLAGAQPDDTYCRMTKWANR